MSNMSSPPRRERAYHSPAGSLPKGRSIYGTPSPVVRPELRQTLSGSRSGYLAPVRITHHLEQPSSQSLSPHLGGQGGPNGPTMGARPGLVPRHTFNGVNAAPGSLLNESGGSDAGFHRRRSSNMRKSQQYGSSKGDSGFIFSTLADRELASIDKINDPLANSLVCAGKSHIGVYRFNREDRSIRLVHEVTRPESGAGSHSRTGQPSMFAARRNRQAKFSTISDVKSGFQSRNNYVALCANSTSISVFDINKPTSDTVTSPLVTSLNEHKRSVNSFDFNMVQPNLIISGGQDGCAKIWDLRANNLKSQTRSDINITTSYESIRDIKWMPSYSFGSPISDTTSSSATSAAASAAASAATSPAVTPSPAFRSNAGYNFCSIHDSGVLLKFDMRQPQQFERKINAHTGPGLCLNWHPNLDYVVTGGRDGKCCLWYVGNERDATQQQQSSLANNNSFTTTMNPSVFPETTINFGSPITKLKFCPAYNEEPHNSLLAISSMGDEAQVGIYSLARKYVPRNMLETPAASLGLVWWDEENIFTIDKSNRINGWDLTKEPTVLENLTKTVTTWRDIEGNGLLFLNQDAGTYDVNNPYFGKAEGSSELHSTVPLVSNASVSQLDLSAKRINSPPPIAPTPQTPQERPSLFKKNSTFMTKSFTASPISSAPSINSSNAAIGVSYDSTALAIESPIVVTMDFPKIVGSMRIEQISKLKSLKKNKKIDKESIAKLQESPIEVFKYLARELEFSVEHDLLNTGRGINADNMADNETAASSKLPDENDNTERDLMKKFGLSEHGTWTNLINKKGDTERKNSETGVTTTPNTGTRSNYQDSLNNERSSKHSSNLTEAMSRGASNSMVENGSVSEKSESKGNRDTPATNDDSERTKFEKRMLLLVDFVSVASHNASVYASINDLLNFKVWVLIRDTILWDLKKMDSMVPEAAEEMTKNAEPTYDDSVSVRSSVVDDRTITRANMRKQSMNSEYSHFNESIGTSSFVEEHPQPFRSPSDESEPELSAHSAIQKLREEAKGRLARSDDSIGHLSAVPPPNISDSGEAGKGTNASSKDSLGINGSAINEDSIEEEDEEETKDEDAKPEKGIPILQNRSKRLSFIDTFMSDAHSPLENLGEEGLRPSLSNNSRGLPRFYSSSFDAHSPRSKVSSLESSSTIPHMPFLKRLSDTKNMVPTINESFSYDDVLKSAQGLKSGELARSRDWDRFHGPKKDGVRQPPWNTETILKQIYEQAAETGNILLSVSIMLLFQDVYHIAPLHIVKSSVAEFISLLHRYELFEIATALLKYCAWDDILGPEGEQSDIRLFCERCGELIVNEASKERLARQDQTAPGSRFGFWYCDNCKKPGSLCVFCERPVTRLAMGVLECGHEGHFECFREWFLDEAMSTCPAGCPSTLNI
ncbi:Rtc1 protein [Maudiozyma humilis]|uniref:Restriction of telomere capping protein 1 n=1 Tax=Maudiozyma humilis TaxID=51915 RepID=A0AAV5S1Z2_MAUHU|nr:Rtc1 protein [Kazachstania humilis]